MRRRRTVASRGNFESLSDVHYKGPFNGRRRDPLAAVIQDLETSLVVGLQ